MKTVLLSECVESLESGSRPRGGIIDGQGEVASLGAEHLADNGGFNFSKVRRIPSDFYKSLTKGRIAQNDILIVKDGATTGKVSFVSDDFPFEEAAVNEHVFRLSVDPEMADPRFVFRYLQSPRGQTEILRDFRGATVGGIGRTFVEKVSLPALALSDQQRIAALLDKADGIRRKHETAVSMADELLDARFLEMFGHPADGRSKLPLRPLSALGRIDTGKTPPTINPDNYGSGVPFVTPGDLGGVISQTNREISHRGALSSKVVEPGATMVCCIGATIGKMGFVTQRSAFNQQINAVTWNNDIDPLFGYFALKFLSDHIARSGTSTTLPILNKSLFSKITIPVPKLDDQLKFSGFVKKTWSARSGLVTQLDGAWTLFRSLSQCAFSGEL